MAQPVMMVGFLVTDHWRGIFAGRFLVDPKRRAIDRESGDAWDALRGCRQLADVRRVNSPCHHDALDYRLEIDSTPRLILAAIVAF